jgi:hypothetical protein
MDAVKRMKPLTDHLPAGGGRLLCVFGGYDAAQLIQTVTERSVALLAHLRADRCFSADPPPVTPSPKGGRPRRHGPRVRLQEPDDLALAERRAKGRG